MKSIKRFFSAFAILGLASGLIGCASVDFKASHEEEMAAKQFALPTDNTTNIYIYRDMLLGSALGKNIYIDGRYLGQTGPKTFYKDNVEPGIHVISTESEFSENHILLSTEPNTNRYIRQFIKIGVFVGGAGLEEVEAEKAKPVIETLTFGKTQNNPEKNLKASKEELLKKAQKI